ncbi:MAG: T9SS type A sorting domain-containing protein, partial [bacterium]
RDGRDEIVVFGYHGEHKFMGQIFDFKTESQSWSQVSFEGDANAMHGKLLDSDNWWVNHNGGGPYKLDVEMQDIDLNGYCDIAFALSGKKNGVNTLFNWVYTFDAKGIEFPKERVSTTDEDAGLDVSMIIANTKGDDSNQIYSMTNKPGLYIINYDREKDEFKKEPPLTTGFNDLWGFDKPVIVAADINNDSYWCRLHGSKIDSTSKEKMPGVGKPVAIITAPPCQEGINSNQEDTHIKLFYAEIVDSLCAVQSRTGMGYTYNVEGGIGIGKLKIKEGFEKVYIDTVEHNSEYRKGIFTATGWEVSNDQNAVLWLKSGYYQYPYRIEQQNGEPVLGDDGEEMWLYILIPKEVGLQLDPWESYIEDYQLMYGETERQALEDFMEPFLRHTPLDVASYFQTNESPVSLAYQLAFPTFSQELNSAISSVERIWGKSDYRSIGTKRYRYWSSSFSVSGSFSWGLISASAKVKTHQFTDIRENYQSENEDVTLIEVRYKSVPEGSEYTFESYAFWGTEEAGIPGTLVISHRVPDYATAVPRDGTRDVLPTEFSLGQNYPNPFNPETTIRFQLPEARHVVLKIFNTLGQEIRKLADRQYTAGYHSIRWDGNNENGNPVSSGVYLYQLQAGDFTQVKKMTLLR